MFHIRTRTTTRAVFAAGLLGFAALAAETQGASSATAQAQAAPAAPAAQAPAPATTPDADIAAKIRKSLADDKALAGYASTLKIIVSDGLVSLKGAVRSDADKKAIEQKAAKIVGEANVMNNMFVSTADAKPQTN
jgi:osmotically-inducible protein OsmY